MSKKNSSVLSLKTLINKNKKITEIYQSFKKDLLSLKKKSFVVAVSGGADSLALCALAKNLSNEKKIKIFYVLVDHGIRKNSSSEAKKVKELLKKQKIKLNILTNKKKFHSNIQGKAREIRYELIYNFCKKNNIKHIITAHHSDDQIETFLIRLSRGSGVQGLSAMQFISKIKGNIFLIRPLLDFKKSEFINLSKNFFGKVFNDPSNVNTKYLRTKIRHLKSTFEKNGILHNQVIKSIKNLAETNITLNNYIKKIYLLNVKKYKRAYKINLKNIFAETSEIQMKVLSQAIREFSKSYYPPRSKKIFNLLHDLKSNTKKDITLSRCIFKKSGNYVMIQKDA